MVSWYKQSDTEHIGLQCVCHSKCIIHLLFRMAYLKQGWQLMLHMNFIYIHLQLSSWNNSMLFYYVFDYVPRTHILFWKLCQRQWTDLADLMGYINVSFMGQSRIHCIHFTIDQRRYILWEQRYTTCTRILLYIDF